jgi:hypothetical protein
MSSENDKPLAPAESGDLSIPRSHPMVPKRKGDWRLTTFVVIALCAMFVTVATVQPYQEAQAWTFDETIDALILTSPAFDMGYAISVHFNLLNSDPGGSEEAVADYLQGIVDVRSDMYTARNDNVNTVLENMDMMESLYLQRFNGLAYDYWRAQEDAGTAHTWNYTAALESENGVESVTGDFSNLIATCMAYYDSIWLAQESVGVDVGYSDLSQSFTGLYSNCEWGVTNGAGTYYFSSPGTVTYFWVEHGYSVSGSYIDRDYYMDDETVMYIPGLSTANTVKIYDSAGVNVANVTGSTTVTEGFSMTDLGLESGIYSFSITEGSNYGLFFNHIMPADVTIPEGSLLPCYIYHGANSADLSDDAVLGVSVSSSEVSGTFFYNGATSTAGLEEYVTFSCSDPMVTKLLNVTKLTRSTSIELIDTVQSLLTDMVSSAQAYYNWCVANNPTSRPSDPTYAFLDPSQYQGLSMEQWLIIYQAYLDEMEGWFNNNTNYMPANTSFSAESLEVRVRGSITNAAGAQLYDNMTIFSVLISTNDMTLDLGPNNLTQSGRFIIWGNAPTIAELTEIERAATLQYDTGWSLFIAEIYYGDTSVSTVTLNLTNLELVLSDFLNTHNGGQPEQTDLEWIMEHWYYVAMVFGVVLLMGAIMTRNTIILAIGLVALAAGAIGYFMQDFSWSDLLSMDLRPLFELGRWK